VQDHARASRSVTEVEVASRKCKCESEGEEESAQRRSGQQSSGQVRQKILAAPSTNSQQMYTKKETPPAKVLTESESESEGEVLTCT
jgi:hypothetical protein